MFLRKSKNLIIKLWGSWPLDYIHLALPFATSLVNCYYYLLVNEFNANLFETDYLKCKTH